MGDIYLEAGDSLQVEKDITNWKAPKKISGPREEAYSFLQLRDSLREENSLFEMAYYDTYELEVDTFKMLMDNRLAWEDSLRTRFFQNKPEWKPLHDLYKYETKYRIAEDHFDYLKYHNYYTNSDYYYW